LLMRGGNYIKQYPGILYLVARSGEFEVLWAAETIQTFEGGPCLVFLVLVLKKRGPISLKKKSTGKGVWRDLKSNINIPASRETGLEKKIPVLEKKMTSPAALGDYNINLPIQNWGGTKAYLLPVGWPFERAQTGGVSHLGGVQSCTG